jgi:hypothetical protein
MDFPMADGWVNDNDKTRPVNPAVALETQTPYDHTMYFSIYAKCAELGIPISVNVGIPGPPVGGRCQDPVALDDVCAFFPELVVVMSHGGDPWAEMYVKLMTKWPSLHYMLLLTRGR